MKQTLIKVAVTILLVTRCLQTQSQLTTSSVNSQFTASSTDLSNKSSNFTAKFPDSDDETESTYSINEASNMKSITDPVNETLTSTLGNSINETLTSIPRESINENLTSTPADSFNETLTPTSTDSINEILTSPSADSINETLTSTPADSVNDTLTPTLGDSINETLTSIPTESINESLTLTTTDSINETLTSTPKSAEETTTFSLSILNEETTELVLTSINVATTSPSTKSTSVVTPETTTTTTTITNPTTSPTSHQSTDEMVEKLTDAVHGIQMIVNKTDITETDLREATKFVDQALQVDQSVLQRSQEHVRSVLLGLDAVIMRIRLQPGERVNTSTQHVTVFVLNVQLGRPAAIAVQGGVGRRSVDEISLADISSEKDPLPPETEAAVILPQSLDNATSHLSFAIFKEDSAFQDPKHNDSRINSFVIGINMADGHELGKDQHVDILFKPRTREGHKECVFWDFELNGGGWSTDGCRLDSWPASQFDTCRCNHLTHFAQIIVPRRLPEDAVLDVVSTVGCSLSLLGLIGVLLTGATSRRWSSRLGNKILMHLSGAEALNMLAFLIAAAGAAQGRAACIAVGVILHYSVLASFCWMLVSAGLQYLRLVSVLGAHHTSHLLLKSSLFAWGAPLLPVCVLLAVDVELYKQDESEFCYPVGLAFYLAVLCPVLLVIIINVSVYGTILHTVFARSSVRRHMQVKRTFWTRRVATSVLLFFLLGLSWVFGLLCSFSTVFVYLFCITATLQGFVLFLFFVLGERETRGHWFSKETTSPPTSGCTQTSNQYLYEATSSIIIPRVRYMEPDPSTCFQKNVTSTFSQ